MDFERGVVFLQRWIKRSYDRLNHFILIRQAKVAIVEVLMRIYNLDGGREAVASWCEFYYLYPRKDKFDLKIIFKITTPNPGSPRIYYILVCMNRMGIREPFRVYSLESGEISLNLWRNDSISFLQHWKNQPSFRARFVADGKIDLDCNDNFVDRYNLAFTAIGQKQKRG